MTRMPRLMGTRDAARYLGASTWTLRELARAGELPVVRHGRGFLFDIRDLDAYVDRAKKKHRPTMTKAVSEPPD